MKPLQAFSVDLTRFCNGVIFFVIGLILLMEAHEERAMERSNACLRAVAGAVRINLTRFDVFCRQPRLTTRILSKRGSVDPAIIITTIIITTTTPPPTTRRFSVRLPLVFRRVRASCGRLCWPPFVSVSCAGYRRLPTRMFEV